MAQDPIKTVIPLLKEAFREGGAEAITKRPGFGEDFLFAPRFPLLNVRLPLEDLADAVPTGVTGEEAAAALESFVRSLEAQDRSLLQLPDGMDMEQLRKLWEESQLFFDSGAVLFRKVAFAKELAKAHIEARGVEDVLLVVDEQYRPVVGLEYFWALLEMDELAAPPVVILNNAPFNAGFQYLRNNEDELHKEFRKSNVLQSALEDATPEEREDLRLFGFFYIPDKITLTCSFETLDRLGVLIRKQLGSKTKLDPAQLLYVETLREAILEVRERMVRERKTEGDVIPKLELHKKEEREALERGAKVEGKNGWRWQLDDDGFYFHPAMPRYRFDVREAEAVEKEAPAPRPVDPYLMSESQFVILARTHFGIGPEEAQALHREESPEDFNKRLRNYVAKVPPVAPKLRGEPSEEEQANQAERLALWNVRL